MDILLDEYRMEDLIDSYISRTIIDDYSDFLKSVDEVANTYKINVEKSIFQSPKQEKPFLYSMENLVNNLPKEINENSIKKLRSRVSGVDYRYCYSIGNNPLPRDDSLSDSIAKMISQYNSMAEEYDFKKVELR